MVRLVRPKPQIPSPRGRHTDPFSDLLGTFGPSTRTYPEFAIPKRGSYDLSVTQSDIETVRSQNKEETKNKGYSRTKYLTYPSPWGGHKDKPKRPTPTVPKEKPKDDEPKRPFPPVEIPDDIGDLPWPFPFPEVPPPSDVPIEPDEWIEDESIPDWREKRPPDPQVPITPRCSDDPEEQIIYAIPPCLGSHAQIQISSQTNKHGKGTPARKGRKRYYPRKARKRNQWYNPRRYVGGL